MNWFDYQGDRYPAFTRDGNSAQFILPVAKRLCTGRGLDVGCARMDWALPGSYPIDPVLGNGDALHLPPGPWDYLFSSHCLEHLEDQKGILKYWKSVLRPGGVLLLYLPHMDQKYWSEHNPRHKYCPRAFEVQKMLCEVGFCEVHTSERDLNWSFAVYAERPMSEGKP